ncbi:putative dehydrogenase [Paraburkholderia unamae]|uniref:Gfo/Idh/MocA family protein n=1 Tax=Paraburkholderia unamae TaxID=219649 RepID=UPI000DC37C12|nr:Gfo/Idh/MocA family oxidoreductase [Paraburkholderia unamae]RAR54975.1 putative dehydrogenase [Paraburkholderia unamae]
MSTLRVAMIGVGLAAAPHALALKDLAREVEVAGVTGRSAVRAATFAREHGFALAPSFDSVVADASIDAVLILTPPHTHLELVEAAAGAGKHVLLEKPLDVSLTRAQRLTACCRRVGVRLGVVFQNRFRPAVQQLATLLQSGALGRLASAGVEVRWWRDQAYYDEPGRGTYARDGGGVLLTQAIHALDLLLWLAGDASVVSAACSTTTVHRMESEDYACAALKFQCGAVGRVFATTAAYPGFPERLEFVAANGTAVLEGGRLDIYWRDGRRESFEEKEAASSGFGAQPMAFDHGPHRALLAGFIAAIREGRPAPVTGDDALKVQRLIAAMTAKGGAEHDAGN